MELQQLTSTDDPSTTRDSLHGKMSESTRELHVRDRGPDHDNPGEKLMEVTAPDCREHQVPGARSALRSAESPKDTVPGEEGGRRQGHVSHIPS